MWLGWGSCNCDGYKGGNEQRQQPPGQPWWFYGQDRAQRYSRYDYCRHLDGNICFFFHGVSPKPSSRPLLFSLSPHFTCPIHGGPGSVHLWMGRSLAAGTGSHQREDDFSEVWLFYSSLFFFPTRRMSLQYQENSLNDLIFFRFCAASIVLNDVAVLEGLCTNRFPSVSLCMKHKMCIQAENLYVHRRGMAA